MAARDVLLEAAGTARLYSYNGMNPLADALADWWQVEAQSHYHLGDDEHFTYDLPGMDDTPAVRAARAYLDGCGV